MTGANESKPEGERGEGFKKAFALTHQTATGRNKAGAVFLCLAMSLRRKTIRGQGLAGGC